MCLFIPKLIPKVLNAAETVCVRKRERERERDIQTDRQTVTESQRSQMFGSCRVLSHCCLVSAL